MTSRSAFLSLVLPALGAGEQYCTVGIKTNGAKNIVRQQFVSSVEAVSAQSDAFMGEGFNVFYGVAKFGSPEAGRTADNAVALKSFFADLDCGVGKPFADLTEGLNALRAFCKATGMPRPTIVQSGRGAHVYWVLETEVSKPVWLAHATKLRELCAEHKFAVDPAVTCDAARVLRVPETLHVKDANNPLMCTVLHVSNPIPVATLAQLLPPVEDPLACLTGPVPARVMDETTLALMGNRQSRFKTILIKSVEGKGCAQIANIYSEQETIPEPLWRAGLSIAQFCVDRDKAIHAISSKHPDYTPTATDRKASETKGPYTCETFRQLDAATCEACTLKITSPITLGGEIAPAEAEDNLVVGVEAQTKEEKTYTIPPYPFPFFRGKNGGVYVRAKNKEDTDVDELVYPYDFYVVKRMQDPDLGETLLLRLHLPQDGVRDFIVPLASVLSKDKFINTVASQGVAVLGKKQESLMWYVTKWVEHLQMSTRAEKAQQQFGWLDDESAIIIGDREIRASEIAYSPPSTPTIQHIPLLQPKGDFHVWKDIVNVYGKPGMEYRAFAFFMGFGTLLMKFTSLDGFLLNLVSRESGSGKTTILQAINSIYGRPKQLMLAPKDTYNSRMQRLGVMQNLAVTMDEITNMPPEQMSQQVYDVTSGRGKHRMRQHDNSERHNSTKWQTGLITSSNRYLTDALLSIKGFPDGELKRLMEINVRPDPHNDPSWARAHFGRLMDNYGHAVQPFAQALVGQAPTIKSQLEAVQLRIDTAAQIQNSERYWALMASLSVTGGLMSKALGLHDIPVKPVFDYAVNLIKDTRKRVSEYMFSDDEFLGGFLQRHFHEILVIKNGPDSRNGLDHAPIREPRGALTTRYEPDTKMLYIVQRTFREDCAKLMLNFDEVLAPYKKTGAFIEIKKKRMTAGTVANTHAPANALCFNVERLDFFNEKVLLEDARARDTVTN